MPLIIVDKKYSSKTRTHINELMGDRSEFRKKQYHVSLNEKSANFMNGFYVKSTC